MKRTTLIAVVIVMSQVSNMLFADVTYNLIPLGNLPGGSGANPYWISNNGQIVGSGFSSTDYAAIKFDESGGGSNISLSNSYSCARSINDNGMIVGYNQGQSGKEAVLFDPSGNGNNITLGVGTDIYGARAYAINNNNQVVGGSGNGKYCKAWLYDITGNKKNLFLGQGEAVYISDNGIIVGNSHPIAGQGWHATIFDPTGGGNNIDLGKLFAGDDRSFAYSVNVHGQTVGYSGGPSTGYTATLFDPTGSGNNIRLGMVGDSYAESINNSGLVVGSEGGYATLFDITGNGNNINLNDLIDPALGWTLGSARYINDNGWIVGNGNMGAGLFI